MNWDALGAIAETLGAIGVIATLAYLAVQIRQNSKLLASSAKQATQTSIYQQNHLAVQNPEIIDVISRGMKNIDGLNSQEKARFHYYWMTGFITYQEAFKEVKLSGTDDDFWNVLEHALIRQLRTPGLSKWWQRNRIAFNPEFVAHFENAKDDA